MHPWNHKINATSQPLMRVCKLLTHTITICFDSNAWGKPAELKQGRNFRLPPFSCGVPDALLLYYTEARSGATSENWKCNKEICRTAAEHVAQPNQYSLVTVGVGLRNKASLIKHIESHSPTLVDTLEISSKWEEVYSLWVIGCHCVCLSQHTCLMTLIIELLFGTSLPSSSSLLPLPPPTASSSSHPRCCYCCDIFLSSIPEVIWLVKLHLFSPTPHPRSASLRFPVWVTAITLVLSLVHDLGGRHRLLSIVMEMTHIYHHGDNLWAVVCHTHPRTQQTCGCVCTCMDMHAEMQKHKTQKIVKMVDVNFLFNFFFHVFLWASASL